MKVERKGTFETLFCGVPDVAICSKGCGWVGKVEECYEEEVEDDLGNMNYCSITICPKCGKKIGKYQSLIEKEIIDILKTIVAIDDASKSGNGLLCAQGQGMDGYTKLANYEEASKRARELLAKYEENKNEVGLEDFPPNT